MPTIPGGSICVFIKVFGDTILDADNGPPSFLGVRLKSCGEIRNEDVSFGRTAIYLENLTTIMDLKSALDCVYLSDTYRKISDYRTGLYFRGAGYAYSFLKHELVSGKMG
ncbi:MAG: hypothetical protein PHD07_04795 [Bacteroidales bacterium]|nr:hypothetical protein [Bacteroidales bacterium]MDD3201199.1 hypothetical protein [Bacteroidales bacterium]